MSSLRKKLAFSYGLLIIIILAVGAWSIYHLVRLGGAVDRLLVDNYKSIVSAGTMQQSLTNQDAAVLFAIAGRRDEGRAKFVSESETFLKALDVAANNITEPGEGEIVKEIESRYSMHRRELERLLNPMSPVDSGELSRDYFERLRPASAEINSKLEELLRVNERAMIGANDRAIRESRRAQISTGIVAILGLALALLFAWRFIAYLFAPIGRLTEGAKRIAEGDLDQRIEIPSNDEVGVLAAEFNRMAARLRDLRKSDYWRMLIEQKKSDALVDSISHPVIVTDPQGRVTKINRAAEQIIGVSRDQIKDDGDASLRDSSAGDAILRAVEDVVKMQRPVTATEEAAIVPVKVGDSEKGFRLRTTPVRDPDGRMIGAVTLLEDTTEIREADRIKDEFISVASRKLRSPLHSLRMALHTLVAGYAGDLSDKQAELLSAAQQDARQLDELISDMLELSEVESGSRHFSLERVKPIELARSAVERHRPVAECKHIELTNHVWSDTPYVTIDRKAINRVFDDLLSNAIRHTERDGKVRIESWERDNFVFVSVRDTGEGIPPDVLSNIFGRFVHVEGTAGGGTGLGLALVKRLVEAQGGQVSVESRLGEGSTFTVALPKSGGK